MEWCFKEGSKLEIMDDDDDEVGSSVSSSSFSVDSSLEDFVDDATSSSSSSALSEEGPLFEMSSLISELPIKRGLSKHFQGKSQSFTSLANAKSLEDLVKPERPYKKKKLKLSKSFGRGLDGNKALSPRICSGSITKKPSKSSFFLPGGKRQSLLGSRPSAQRSTGVSRQTLLFA